jgi:16S rRNA A1518/A1519 N6-dimethyltransferase RsmA/KsgA/DIM1 with predicted DNA glycosylase/AP lyase activity
MDLLRRECALTPSSTVADIGFGMGILTEMFLENEYDTKLCYGRLD